MASLTKLLSQRAKIESSKPIAPETHPISPTLVPSLPQPMAPTPQPTTPQDELSFFDRVKKYMSNKTTFTEFLKLCNLFTQELIDKNTLMHKAVNFIGGNSELINFFKTWIQYNGVDEIIENKPKPGGEKVVLSNCRGLGPSYRLLPRRERLRPCSGRDEMCQAVLNDEWVSHPTWASEDSGFIAHRKNLYEDAMHRIEEERHDYDFNIEACLRTIQLIEPIVQQLKFMTDEERATYVLPPGIGGQSETIYQRVIKKIYDRQRGQAVIDDMFRNPAAVLPIVLGRLKQKAEEWKASMREWDKVWREQTNRMFWKSLDHQGIIAKASDKRQFQPKALVTDIQVRYEEQRRQRIVSWKPPPRWQFTYVFDDKEVIKDACHLILTHLYYSDNRNDEDRRRLEKFFTTFIPTFFGLDQESFQAHMTDIHDITPPNEDAEDESLNEDNNAGRPRRVTNGRKGNLLRGVLERGKPGREINGRDSRESTPDVSSMEEDAVGFTETPTERPIQVDLMDYRWMEHPSMGDLDPKAPYYRDTFNLYASLNIYCFFRMFQMLYARLLNIKDNEQEVHKDIARSNAPKAALDLHLIERRPSEFFEDTTASANYYHQVVTMCEDVMKQKVEAVHLEDTLRRFYVMKGWQLYNHDKMIASINRFAMQILVSDNKDKSLEIINLFYNDRAKEETTHDAEIIYRKQVDKLTKDADIFRITYVSYLSLIKQHQLTTPQFQNPKANVSTISIFKKDDPTFSVDAMEAGKQWAVYTATFAMLDKTESVDIKRMHWPFLRKNLPPNSLSEGDFDQAYLPFWSDEKLICRIDPESYRLTFRDPETTDRFVHHPEVQRRGLNGIEEKQRERKQLMSEKFGLNNKWIKEMDKSGVEQINEDFRKWINEGIPSPQGPVHEEAEQDA